MSLPITTRWRWLPRWNDSAGGHADLHGDFRRHRKVVGLAADAVGAEIVASSCVTCPRSARSMRSARIPATGQVACQRITLRESMSRNPAKSLREHRLVTMHHSTLKRRRCTQTKKRRRRQRGGVLYRVIGRAAVSALRLRLHAAFRLVAASSRPSFVAPAFGTAEPRDGGVSSPRSRDGFLPAISCLISSPDSVSYSSSPSAIAIQSFLLLGQDRAWPRYRPRRSGGAPRRR